MNDVADHRVPGQRARALGCVLLALILAGCQSRPCPLIDNLAGLRACYCELEKARLLAEGGAVDPEPDAALTDFEQHLSGLLSDDFEAYVRAGDALVRAGAAGLQLLFDAPALVRRDRGMDQDPLDHIILVILETDLDDTQREELLSSPEPMHRLYGLRSIRFRRAGIADGHFLLAALDDPNFHVREEALEALHVLTGESRIRKPRNVLYRTPSLRQQREIWVWKRRGKKEGASLFVPIADGER